MRCISQWMGNYMRVMSLDFETSIGVTIHGPTFRDPANDIYTQIWAFSPEEVEVSSSSEGYERKLIPSLDDVDVIVGHNLGFDLAYIWHDEKLRSFILRGGMIWDTQVAEYLLTAQQHAFSSLAELQLKYLGEKEKPSRISYLYSKGIGADKMIKAFGRCPKFAKLYSKYCHSDGATPLKIHKLQYAKAVQSGMLPIIELYNDYLLSLVNMTVTGIKIDVQKCEETLRDFNAKHLEYLSQAQDIVRPMWDKRLPTFNINSPDHKSAVLFGGNIAITVSEKIGVFKNGNDRYKNVTKHIWVDGFRVPTSISSPSKKSGVYSVDADTIQKIAEKTKNPKLKEYCELQKQALMYKKAAKTYCQAFLDRSVYGILHPNFNNTLTSTSRLSSSAPNMQNVSKRNEFGKILHSLFIAPPGYKCVAIDFSQLEIWVLALLSNDRLLIKHLQNGTDLHTVRLQYYNDKTYDELYQLCKVDKDPYWDKQRTDAKKVSYQMAYGAMPKKVAASTGLELSIVETIFEKEATTYVDASAFGTKVRESLSDNVRYSMGQDIPASQKKGMSGSRILDGFELLPIFDKEGNVSYNSKHRRQVGYYTSITGKQYSFLATGRMFKNTVSSSFSFTQPKNYPMQGTAADIQGITTAALLKALLSKSDKIQMINEVHDSKWFYVREDVLQPCLKWLKETIEDVPKLFKQRFDVGVPFKFPVDVETGANFGDMIKYEF